MDAELLELKQLLAETMPLSIGTRKQLDMDIATTWKAIESLRQDAVEMRHDIRATNADIVAIGESVKALQQTVEAYIKGIRNGRAN